METLTADKFKQKYGVVGTEAFKAEKKKEGLFDEIRQAFSQGIGRAGQGIQEAGPISGSAEGIVPGVGKILGGVTQAITAPLAPIFNRTIEPAINAIGEKIGSIPAVQKFAASPTGEKTSQIAETVADYAGAAGLVAGGPLAGRTAAGIPGMASKGAQAIPKPKVGAVAKDVKGAVRDIIPTRQNYIDSSLAKALDLTQDDLRNIAASTKNEVGPWLAQNNLIGKNKADTQAMIKQFFTENYQAVRTEIGKVKNEYLPVQVPRYTDALKAIQLRVTGVVGLEKQAALIDNMLRKEKLTLKDVQAAKELIDDYSSLYNKQGDVLQGIEKQGLATVRDGLKTFIEDEVQKNTGADVRPMNNNVATAKNIGDAITARSQRGLTRVHVSNRDIMTGLGLTYFGTPLLGVGYVLLSKIWQSPSMRLRVARYLDKLNDAQKMKISEQINNGKIPPEILKEAGMD